MHIQYLAVPAHRLPEGVQAHAEQYEDHVLVLMDERHATPLMAEALTEAINEHAQQSWIHCASFGWDQLLTSGGGLGSRRF